MYANNKRNYSIFIFEIIFESSMYKEFTQLHILCILHSYLVMMMVEFVCVQFALFLKSQIDRVRISYSELSVLY